MAGDDSNMAGGTPPGGPVPPPPPPLRAYGPVPGTVPPNEASTPNSDEAATRAPGGFPATPRWRRIGYFVAWGLAAVLALFTATVLWLALTAPLSRSLRPNAPPSITLVSADGVTIARKGAVIEAPVKAADLPPRVTGAFIAIEDRRFYSHWGVDPRGILRAFWNNLRAGGVREGGSTITQQLAKGAFLNADRTAGRKLREVLIALWLEAWLTKQQILERYLSNVYFGDNVYGLRAAAHHYFSRDPERLTVGQAAMLAAMLKAPSRLAPTVDLAGNRARANLVLDAMVETGMLPAAERKQLKPPKLVVQPVPQSTSGSYFADWVLPQARDRAGDVYGEQTVTTTLDSKIQKIVDRSVRRAGLGKAQVAVVVMRPDGTVVAMAGGRRYADSPFNRATQSRRQPGSTFKLFVYLAAIRSGMTPDDRVDDLPITEGDYRPQNAHGRYRGSITLRQAFAASSNVAAVRLAQKVGMAEVIRAARDLGVTAPLPDNLSVALGSSGISLLELAQAYAAIAGDSYPVIGHGLPEAEQSWFRRLLDRRHSFSDRELEQMRDLLSAATNGGTGRNAALRTATFGKTGTTQDNRDALFVGYAGGLVTAIWVGNDDNSPLPGVFGGGLPARLWRDIMVQAVEQGRVEGVKKITPEGVMDDAANAILNVAQEVDPGNVSIDVRPDTVKLRGAGGLSIDIPLAGQKSPATPSPPATPPANASAP